MKITFVSDTHFGNRKLFSKVTSSGYNTRFLDQLSVFTLIPEDTDVFCHLGDLFHNKFRIENFLYDKVYSEIFKLQMPHKLLIGGNHDFYNYWREPTLFPFSRILKLFVNDYGYFDYENVRLHCVPYPDRPTNFHKNMDIALSNLGKDINILLSHLGIEGAEIGSSNTQIYSDVFIQDLRAHEFDFVFLGHYHKHQRLEDNIYYVGSPVQQDFGERNETKGIMTLQTETGKLEFIENIVAPKFVQFNAASERELYKLKFNRKDYYKVVLDGMFDRQVLLDLSNKFNIIFEGGGVKRTEDRLEVEDNSDIIAEYCKLNDVGEEYVDFGKGFI